MRVSPAAAGNVPPAKLTQRQKRAASVYRPNYADLAHKYALLGAKDERIAELLGVKLGDVEEWQLLYPEFAGMLEQGRTLADAEMAQALFEKGRGYQCPDTKFWLSRTKDAEGNETVEVIEKTYVAHYPPDTAAIQFWLTNRDGANWKHASHQTIDGSLDLNVTGISALLKLVESERAKPAEVTSLPRKAA
jgi:hypothetical protein